MMKHIKIKPYTLLLVLAWAMISCEKDLAISQTDIISDYFNTGEDISRIYLTPGGKDNSNGGYMDFRSGTLYTFEQMEDNYHNVDLAYTYSSISGNNLLAMDAKNVSFSDVGEEIEHVYPYKNKSEMYVYTNSTDEDINWFFSLSTTKDIQQGYDSLLNVLYNRYGHDLQSSKRIANLKKGDIVLYLGTSRQIKSLIYVESIATSPNGTMNLIIKSDMREPISFQKPNLPLKSPTLWSDTLTLEANVPYTGENYIDLFQREVYKAEDLINNDVSHITLLHTFDGLSSNFYTMTSSYIGSIYRPDLWNWINTLPSRNEMHLLRIDNHARYLPGYTFEDIRNNNVALREYGNYIGGTAWSSRFTGSSTVAPGLVVLIRDKDNIAQGIMKVIEVDNNTGICKIALKYVHDE